MDIYLPIAEVSVNLFLLLGLGGFVGSLSGMFGVGGGFLMTPLLIVIGIPPAVAVGSGACEILAASTSGVIGHMRRNNVDTKMGIVLVVGGALGSAFGAWLFRALRELGQIDLVISLAYVVLLGLVGGLMLIESVRALLKPRRRAGRGRFHRRRWLHRLPFKMRFQRSRLYISAMTPLCLGVLVGVLAAMLGVGGGFLMVPAMIYAIGMPTQVVVGTSLFQLAFVSAVAIFLHAFSNHTVDVVLAVALIVGGVLGVQFGTRIGARLSGEQLRILLALIVVIVCGRLGYDLVTTPDDLYSLGVGGHAV